ncbi:hypothetical protein QJS04_geneDACA020162 [Acorus gramineus]|uniref:Uncharacterized protein n=1 Tax=Acorus gramineus TaxID=55184 RepID=A0AAV9BP22_ACOGR|nr:hypothetical protein QJS04_geneDACA020162 [Acorus gramineus]
MKINRGIWRETHRRSQRSGVSFGVPRVLTSRWRVETAVFIWKIPVATSCDGSFLFWCLPLVVESFLDGNGTGLQILEAHRAVVDSSVRSTSLSPSLDRFDREEEESVILRKRRRYGERF